MIDPTLEIRQHYLSRLAGLSVPAYNMPQQTIRPPFVVVTTRAMQIQLTKCETRNWDVTTTFDIVVLTDGDYGGDKAAEDIANEMMPLIEPLGDTANFRIATFQVEASDPQAELYTTGRVIRKVIILSNFVSQLN